MGGSLWKYFCNGDQLNELIITHRPIHSYYDRSVKKTKKKKLKYITKKSLCEWSDIVVIGICLQINNQGYFELLLFF